MDKNKKVLVTSALPYVNNIPHLGNIIGCVLSADVFVKYCKIAGYKTMFVCGTDEYGTTTVARARQEGLTPREICDKYHKIHKEIYDWLGIEFDRFGRTSDKEQTEIVQSIFKSLYENGYITQDELTQPYCEHDKMFLADRYIEGVCPHCGYEKAKGDQCENCGKLLDPAELKKPKCTICGATPIFKNTKHLFLDLEKLKDPLEKWMLKASVEGGWSNNAIAVTKGWIEQGLKKRCITRDLDWGVKVPLEGFENKVFYVWFDAPIGYISITAGLTGEWEKWWKDPDNTLLYQFMGKDNIPFHTVLFPASLIGTGQKWTMLNTISSTEYLNYEELKFSKSRGTGVFGDQIMETGIDADLYRYYLLRNRPEKNDTQFYWNDFMEKVNGEIIANYGNLVNRVLHFINRYFDGIIPDFDTGKESVFGFADFDAKVKDIIGLYEKVELKKALLDTLELCSAGNKFFQDKEPWSLIKTSPDETARIIGGLAGFVKEISILLYPFIPTAIRKFFENVNLSANNISISKIGDYSCLSGLKINPPAVLFNKLEKEQIDKLREKYAGKDSGTEKTADFAKILLKTGKIIEIKRHPQADKLYVEKIDLGGGEIRQIVSGLVPFFSENELLGKIVIVAANLKPAKLRGEMSQGMILAVEDKASGTLEVISPDCNPGEIVTINGVTPKTDEITIDEFFTVPLEISDYKMVHNGAQLFAAGKEVKTIKVPKGNVR